MLTASAPARAFYERIGGRPDERRTDESECWPCDGTAYVWEDLPRALKAAE